MAPRYRLVRRRPSGVHRQTPPARRRARQRRPSTTNPRAAIGDRAHRAPAAVASRTSGPTSGPLTAAPVPDRLEAYVPRRAAGEAVAASTNPGGRGAAQPAKRRDEFVDVVGRHVPELTRHDRGRGAGCGGEQPENDRGRSSGRPGRVRLRHRSSRGSPGKLAVAGQSSAARLGSFEAASLSRCLSGTLLATGQDEDVAVAPLARAAGGRAVRADQPFRGLLHHHTRAAATGSVIPRGRSPRGPGPAPASPKRGWTRDHEHPRRARRWSAVPRHTTWAVCPHKRYSFRARRYCQMFVLR